MKGNKYQAKLLAATSLASQNGDHESVEVLAREYQRTLNEQMRRFERKQRKAQAIHDAINKALADARV